MFGRRSIPVPFYLFPVLVLLIICLFASLIFPTLNKQLNHLAIKIFFILDCRLDLQLLICPINLLHKLCRNCKPRLGCLLTIFYLLLCLSCLLTVVCLLPSRKHQSNICIHKKDWTIFVASSVDCLLEQLIGLKIVEYVPKMSPIGFFFLQNCIDAFKNNYAIYGLKTCHVDLVLQTEKAILFCCYKVKDYKYCFSSLH